MRGPSEYIDAEAGLVYLRARYYDPATGQFISNDPIADVTAQPYSYAGNDPLNGTDPTGLFCLVHNSHGGCLGAGVAKKAEDVAVAVRNAPVTAVTAGVNVATGGDCHTDKHLTVVCEGGALSDLGDTAFTTGNTVNVSTGFRGTFNRNPGMLEHEWRHSRQWAVLGPLFVPEYVANTGVSEISGHGQCWNLFEWEAGFEAGGYSCSGFAACRRGD